MLLCCLYVSTCYILLVFVFFFCFKQKTAYEMRISDWSSDVCSSDLYARRMRSTAPKLKQHKKWPENRSQMHLPSPATRNKDMTPASSPQQNGTIRRRAKRNCRLIANPIQIANKNSASAPSAIGDIPDSFAKSSNIR